MSIRTTIFSSLYYSCLYKTPLPLCCKLACVCGAMKSEKLIRTYLVCKLDMQALGECREVDEGASKCQKL